MIRALADARRPTSGACCICDAPASAPIVDADTTARIAALIHTPQETTMTTVAITTDIADAIAIEIYGYHDDGVTQYGALWAALRDDLLGAPLLELTRELQSAQFQAWQSGSPEDADLIATARACQSALARLTPPAMRGLSEVAQLIGEVSVVAGAVRWTAGAIGEQIQRVRDRRRQERDSEVQNTDLIELY